MSKSRISKSSNTYFSSVIADALEGDSNSFAVLYASSFQEIYKKCCLSLDNIYDVQDVMYDTYVVAYHRLGELANPDSFLKWLGIICDGRIKAYLKKKNYSDSEIKKRLKGHGKLGKNADPMNLDNASQLLESIFLAVDKEPNSVALETLLSYHQYRSSKLILQRILPIVIIIALIFIPLLLITPTITLTKDNDKSNASQVVYNIKVVSLLPVKTVIADLSGANAIVTQEDAEDYSVILNSNGDLTVEATLINTRSAMDTAQIYEIDRTPPTVTDYRLDNGMVLIVVEDEGYGVNYNSITLTRISDMYVSPPTDFDAYTGMVYLPYFGEDAVLYLEDNVGNSTSYSLTPR